MCIRYVRLITQYHQLAPLRVSSCVHSSGENVLTSNGYLGICRENGAGGEKGLHSSNSDPASGRRKLSNGVVCTVVRLCGLNSQDPSKGWRWTRVGIPFKLSPIWLPRRVQTRSFRVLPGPLVRRDGVSKGGHQTDPGVLIQ